MIERAYELFRRWSQYSEHSHPILLLLPDGSGAVFPAVPRSIKDHPVFVFRNLQEAIEAFEKEIQT
jgi:hypothetical protein